VDRKPVIRFPEHFVLFVSTIEIRKNHQLLIDVWQRLIEKHGWAAVPHLVFVGRAGWLVDNMMRRLEESHNLDGKVVIASGLADAELEHAYRSCRLTVFPSLSEGWGLPVAESLEHGKFCVASDRASIPEVGGDLADYFDPDDFDDALRKIERALFDAPYLALREHRIRSDFRRASWAACTDDLMAKLQGLSEQSVVASVMPD
jgi:glycosyltransferase involved in cell wall biosynthesis